MESGDWYDIGWRDGRVDGFIAGLTLGLLIGAMCLVIDIVLS